MSSMFCVVCFFFFFFNDTATTEIYTLSLHDALPIHDTEINAFPCYHSRKSHARRSIYAICATHSFAGDSARHHLGAPLRELRGCPGQRIRDERRYLGEANLPDRPVLYLWPNAGGTKLTFAFRPRFGLKARSAPSVLYDYYNPEALVALPPADFNVQARTLADLGKTVAAK